MSKRKSTYDIDWYMLSITLVYCLNPAEIDARLINRQRFSNSAEVKNFLKENNVAAELSNIVYNLSECQEKFFPL
jgi:hypothetical protein